ncbi:hypothetical protein Tco_1534600, partial [Tanacetum coccineum]
MLAKQNDPISKEEKINTTPINYVEFNRLSKDFGKWFVPQQELSAEQAFWSQTSHPNTDQSDISPVKIEAPRELPKLQAKDTTIHKLKEHIKSMRENDKEEKVKQDMDEIETINIELAHRMFKLNLDPLAPRLLKNRDAHIDYLKYTQEQTYILWGIVKQAKAKQPLDNVLDFD